MFIDMDFSYIFTDIFDLFFPKICLHCKKNLCNKNELLCKLCLVELPKLSRADLKYAYLRKCSQQNHIKNLFSLYKFSKDSPIQTLIHELKYQNKFNVAKELGEKIATEFFNDFTELELDLIIPVPLHKVKKAERGYNQSYFISKGISRIIGVKTNDNILIRSKFTPSQTKLNKIEREENVGNAFKLRKKTNCKNVLLVDDVITTGATINSCAKSLNEIGINNIYAASIALA